MTDHILYYGAASPFARKARIAIREKGLTGRIEERATVWAENGPDFLAANPLGKVPALTRPQGPPLCDSAVICDYLDGLGDGPVLYPDDAAQRIPAAWLQALSDGILDATVFLTMNGKMFDGNADPRWQQRQKDAIRRGLTVLEQELDDIAAHAEAVGIDIGLIGLALLPAYLDLRAPLEDGWRPLAPRFAEWADRYAESRPSFTETAPPPA